MKRITISLLAILFIIPIALFSQDEVPALLYEVVTLEVESGQDKAFLAAVKSHNEKFHPDGIYHADLHYNVNGPNAGLYSWIMGPTNYTALDSRPGEGAHDDDWELVNKYVTNTEGPSYWSADADLSQVIPTANNEKSLIWMYDIKKGQASRWADLVEQVKEVYAAKRPTEQFLVAWNDFADTRAGQDAVVIFPFDKWSWMDRKSNFMKQYEEVHGAGTWHNFLNAFAEVTNGRVDWMRVRID